MAIAEKSFNRIERRIRGTLMNKRFPMVLQTILLYCNNIRLYGKEGGGGGRPVHTLKGYESLPQ